jgi:aspartyl-tRNA(Asn)/glutamyl-tRNA(Gln) amidotransferase subunit C
LQVSRFVSGNLVRLPVLLCIFQPDFCKQYLCIDRMSVTAKDVAYIAELAKLRFSDEEQEKMARELNAILHYVEKLNEVDTEGVEPLSSIHDQQNVFRPDCRKPSIDNQDALKNAPDREDRFFKVPKVIG